MASGSAGLVQPERQRRRRVARSAQQREIRRCTRPQVQLGGRRAEPPRECLPDRGPGPSVWLNQ